MFDTIRSFMGPWGVVPFGDHMPDNSLGDMNALAKAHAAARAQRLAAGHTGSLIGPPAPPAPSPPISGISPGFQDQPTPTPSAPAAPPASPQMSWMFGGPSPGAPRFQPAPQQAPAAQTAAPQSAPQVPMPQARPADAPQAQPDTSFFMRNALMQHDPISGQLLDPSAASSVSGPDLISKMMTYLHGKASA